MIERPLIVSPTLAATLGLHEAILLQLLTEWAQLHGGEDSWQLIDKDQLQQLLPFWQEPEIDRILLQLQSQGVITLTSALNSSVRNVRFSLNSGNAGSTETSSPVRERTRAQPRSPAPRPQQTVRATSPYNRDAGATPIDSSWQPDRESINYLTRFHGVDPTFIDAILPEFIAYWRDKGDARASWNSTFTQNVVKRWKKHQYDKTEEAQLLPIPQDWQPSEDALEILERADIDRSFIEDAVPEFVLYWRENGRRDRQWNTRFIEHVRRQWAHYTNAIEHDTEPKQIPADWQPGDAVFDILHMANIDADFARKLLPEFRLYWQDSRQLQRSWNSKFLQHVKYQWAQRHRMGENNAGQQNPDGKSQSEAEKLFRKLTDRSWASGLTGKTTG